MEGEKFNLGERNSAIKFRQKVQICLVSSVQTRSAHRLSSQLFAAVSTSNIAELVLFGFFCPQPWFLRRFEHILPRKTPAFSCFSLSRKKEISIKINYENNVKCPWPSGLVTGVSRRRAGFDTQREQEFFFLCFFFFNKTTWMRVFSQINNCQQKQNKKTKQKTKAKNRQNKKGGSAFRLG